MSIQQVGTSETLASAIKTDAFKWTWDSWTHWQARKENVSHKQMLFLFC